MAVGKYVDSTGHTLPLAERWTGASWSIIAVPAGELGAISSFTGASCTSSTYCTAVGTYEAGNGQQQPLAERWNSDAEVAWVREKTVNVVGLSPAVAVTGVSCTSFVEKAVLCTLTGSYAPSGGLVRAPLIEHAAGTEWELEEAAKPSGEKSYSLNGVSCNATSIFAAPCTAVGLYLNSAEKNVTLAEGSSGQGELIKWSVQSTPNPGVSSFNDLLGVSCASSTACTAAGTAEGNELSGGAPLVEAWNGSAWSIQTVPSPKEATGVALRGVSCTASAACTAVGDYINGVGVRISFAERYQ